MDKSSLSLSVMDIALAVIVVDVALAVGIKWVQLLKLWEGVMKEKFWFYFRMFFALYYFLLLSDSFMFY
ncbi:hypothetical protein ACFLR7_02840 [Acidobacteriota bacterium]